MKDHDEHPTSKQRTRCQSCKMVFLWDGKSAMIAPRHKLVSGDDCPGSGGTLRLVSAGIYAQSLGERNGKMPKRKHR